MRQDRRSRRVAQHQHLALGLHFLAFGLGVLVRGLDDFSVLAQHVALRLSVRLGVDVDRLEEGSGERRRELQQPVGQCGLRLEREPEREQPELQFLELQHHRPAEERVEVITS